MAAAALPNDILFEKRRRLHLLERQAAQLGRDTPPQIATEIADLHAEIGAAAPNSVAESHGILYDLIKETRDDVRRLYWLIPILMVLLCAFLVVVVLVA
jgi:hypothetical protein